MSLNPAISEAQTLPALVNRAASTLAGAITAAEVLEARDMASVAYDAAKSAARIARAREAHDELIQRVYRAQADALDIEAQAKRRLADEYDAAQERGEVAKSGDTLKHGPGVPKENAGKASAADIGISRKAIHEARTVRDAEKADPGIVRRVIDSELAEGRAPTRAAVRRATGKASGREPAPKRGKDAVSARVRETISALCGLPPAAEVAGYLRDTDHAILIDEQLATAAEWLREFTEAWENPNA